MHHDPDPTFSQMASPTRCLRENRSSTADAVIEEQADFGVAFDGDFDRCFFFDHSGGFIPGEYVVGLLAEVFLNKEKRIHDYPRPPRHLEYDRRRRKFGGCAVASKRGTPL